MFGLDVYRRVEKKILVCPHCGVSVNNGKFTEDVTYTVNVEPSEEGSDYVRGSIEDVLEESAQPQGEYKFYCQSCDCHFESFDKKPVRPRPDVSKIKPKEDKS